MQVIYATRAMLDAGLMEEKEEKEITREDSNDNPLQLQMRIFNLQVHWHMWMLLLTL